MQTYVSMALLLLPGFLFRTIIRSLTDTPLKKNTFEKTIISLIWSIPILILNLIWLNCKRGIETYEQLMHQFNNLKFIIYYVILSIISCIFLLIAYLLFKIIKNNLISNDGLIVNKLRELLGYEFKTSKENPWQEFFNSKDIMAIEIFVKKEKVCGGFIKNWDLEGFDYQDIVVEHCEDFEEYKSLYMKKKLKNVPIKNIYINPTKELIIKEYLFDEKVLND